MRIKNGKYAIYRGIEYKLDSKRNGNYLLSSETKPDEEGFRKVYENRYVKEVTFNELEEAYRREFYCRHNGIKYQIVYEEDDCYVIETFTLLKVDSDFEQVDKGVFRKKVPNH
ncbi:hypothetical protein [Caldalkalibacillus salinus]|uniref:hypothetical protein n=1 Tax=Caldalkalibacillus salinus TaxID=2803787 RepID=UPI001924485E|nr:hypothetical protein [Caldalkalibacillus salinus]